MQSTVYSKILKDFLSELFILSFLNYVIKCKWNILKNSVVVVSNKYLVIVLLCELVVNRLSIKRLLRPLFYLQTKLEKYLALRGKVQYNFNGGE